jgi:glycerol-3-phosphate dehydrogenase
MNAPTTSYDVVIVGAGVIGTAVAAALSQYRCRVLLLEAGYDVASGATKANSAIACSGYDTTPGTLESKLVRESSPQWEMISAKLQVPFRRIGSLVLAMTEEDEARLARVQDQATANGVPSELLTKRKVTALSPLTAPTVRAALHVPSEGIIDPILLAIRWAELAVTNGVQLKLNSPVTGFQTSSDGSITIVDTPTGTYRADFVVNATGLEGQTVSNLAAAESPRVWPRKGQFLVVDREFAKDVTKILVPIPNEHTRGVLAIPTTNGGLLIGPTAEDIEDHNDKTTDEETLTRVLATVQTILPSLQRQHVIKTFAGLRPASDPAGYQVCTSKSVPNLVQALGIRSTGISSSPAVAEVIVGLLADLGLNLKPARDATDELTAPDRLIDCDDARVLSERRSDQQRLIVCACEHVSAAEIQDALARRVPPTSIDAVRKRTRATGGRCQGAFCAVGVGFMLSVATGQQPWQVEQYGPQSTWGICEA